MVLKMMVSMISTVKNEERNIREFVNSTIKQTKKPDEFIIIDGGSTDKTYEILKKVSKKYKWIKVYLEKGSNISKGRNLAIEKAKNEIIVSVDAGTKYKKDWLEKLVKTFLNTKADVGFGQTLPLIKTAFQQVLARKLKQRFGSSRNTIFKKYVWKKVGGYPEYLDFGEDTLFNEKIKKAKFKIVKIPEAVGFWEMRHNLEEVKKQFYNYGYWDGVAYKKYHILPLKHKIAVIGLTLLLPIYPLLLLFSKISLSLKIDVVRRFAYLKGFWRGLMK